MDPKQFYDKLKQYGELKQVKVPKTAARREADEPDTIYRHGQEFTIDEQNNPTRSLIYKCLHPKIEACEDCDQIVTDRVIHSKVYQYPIPHWRQQCQHCQLFQNPKTGVYDLTSQETSNAFHQHLGPVDQNGELLPISTIKYRKLTK